MNIVKWNQLNSNNQSALMSRPAIHNQIQIKETVSTILSEVIAQGDKAIKQLCKQFQNANLNDFYISEDEFSHAEDQVSQEDIKAIEFAINRIRNYHEQQLIKEICYQAKEGIVCFSKTKAIEKVGLYVPGGSAPLVSTVMMSAIPAQIAGCRLKLLATPCDTNGNIDPRIILTANRCGIDKILKVGGAQAIAAMAYGTESIPKVDKIFGPGNAYVTQAKQLCCLDANGTSIDMPAGPSEVLVIADEFAQAEIVASDLLSQAEHGPDSQVILLTTSEILASAVLECIEKQAVTLSRSDILRNSLEFARLIIVEDIETALSISNNYAPEHLIINVKDAENYIDAIESAGSVFLGPYAPETFGDYVTGSNHILPTYGYARSVSGLSVSDFTKTIHFQNISKTGFAYLAEPAIRIAEIEQLDAHKQAVVIRKQFCEAEYD